MRAFIRAHLDPVDRLGEVMFSLIMSLGFIGACRLELAEADNRAMLIGVFGCNLAWAIVDGVMYVFSSQFQRGLRGRLIRNVVSARSEDEALLRVAEEFDDRVEDITSAEERRKVYQALIQMARQSRASTAKVSKKDVLGGIAVTLLIVVSTLPVVAPFALMKDPLLAIRVASGIALVLLFIVGYWWGRMVGANPLRIGAVVTSVGIVLVVITVALGG
jgi:hypothetical protein